MTEEGPALKLLIISLEAINANFFIQNGFYREKKMLLF
jgi:hypothetical protein